MSCHLSKLIRQHIPIVLLVVLKLILWCGCVHVHHTPLVHNLPQLSEQLVVPILLDVLSNVIGTTMWNVLDVWGSRTEKLVTSL